MPLNAFIVRPFGTKTLLVKATAVSEGFGNVGKFATLRDAGNGMHEVQVDFDAISRRLIEPALKLLGVQGRIASDDVAAGNIREDMFNRLLTADLVLADVSMHNANVFYELGIRQAFRERHTFVLRCRLSDYPFDLQTDRYHEYDLERLATDPMGEVVTLSEKLRATLSSNEPDSPVFKLMPALQSEDRGRFIAVPDEFHEEVDRARGSRHREYLSVLAAECENSLWEAEGLRLVGRAQFDANFIDGARSTWERIVNRYPDDVEANTSLSTIYQRQNELMRSQQALARVSRVRTLTVSRQSELRALEGRNLKEAWYATWCEPTQPSGEGASLEQRQRTALLSPLLQLACDAFLDAFQLDLNNSYAGLNALTLTVIQAELAELHLEHWDAVQRHPGEGRRELDKREETVRSLVGALRLALESDRARLGRTGQVDPWFNLLESSVMCILSTKPDYVERLYEKAVHFAPLNAGESIRRSLEPYSRLDIQGSDRDGARLGIGCIQQNVRRALGVLCKENDKRSPGRQVRRIVMFVGLRMDGAGGNEATHEEDGVPPQPAPRAVFPQAMEAKVTEAVRAAVRAELEHGDMVLAIAGGANGGDLIFHEVVQELGAEYPDRVMTRLCLALPKPMYVGQYVAPSGGSWVERFAAVYRRVGEQAACDERANPLRRPIRVFAESNDLPRWLHGQRHYNVGRRNNLWMLEHALTQCFQLGEQTECTLIAMVTDDPARASAEERALGGVRDIMRRAELNGFKVVPIRVEVSDEGERPKTLEAVKRAA